MNKKRLSVVMAGAMLASSVAPVLAAETTTQKDYTVNGSNRGLLIKSLRELILTKGIFANVTANDELAGHSVHYATIAEEYKENNVPNGGNFYQGLLQNLNSDLHDLGLLKGNEVLEYSDIASAIGKGSTTITYKNAENKKITINVNIVRGSSSKSSYGIVYDKKYDNTNIAELETAIQKATSGTVIKVWDAGHIEKDGKYYGKTLEVGYEKNLFTTGELKAAYDAFKAADPTTYPAVLDMEFDGKVLTVKTRLVGEETEASRKVLTYKADDVEVNFTKAVNVHGVELEPNLDGTWITENIAGFAEVPGNEIPKGKDLEDKELYKVTITDVDNEQTIVLSELYNGLFLTEKGEELLEAMKEYDEKDRYYVDYLPTVDKSANGLYTVTLTFTKTVNKNTTKNVVKITSNNLGKIEFFAKGIKAQTVSAEHGVVARKFPVQKLVGATRHETAVKVAKENADIRTVAENGNIVLVNSDSLVDGLAAAPLAASVINEREGVTPSITNKKKNYVAPILLTNRDGLDKVTKDYIKEVVAHQRVGNLDKVTVYLVGGEAVISKAVENDLKEAGLRVVRAGGKDREATSLRVAELITKDTKAKFDSAFLVGADGAPDAMSVASVAADTKLSSTDNKITPIIVESVHGISEETIEFLKGYKVDTGKNVTIVGGEKVVSAATEATLKAELKGKKVDRLAGANRKETNAKVMSTFYGPGSLSHILVSKDGIAKEGELIDALTATSIAAKYHTPIVLGTNELTKSQIEAIEDATNRDADKYVYQIGGNVAESVVRTIADRLSLSR